MAYVSLFDIIYPIGSVYASFNSTSPASKFGGSWSQIVGYFPYYNSGTGTGGENEHRLTGSEMPDHHHVTLMRNDSGGAGSNWCLTSTYGNSKWETGYLQSAGAGYAHNNMPRYQSMYAWRRTS